MTFNGFPPGKIRQTQIPAQFFSDLLPQIDDLAELKITLFCFWALHQKEGKYRFLRRRDFLSDAALMLGLANIDKLSAEEALDAALAASTQRATLLCGTAHGEALYFMNTAQGREALRQLQAGTWTPDDAGRSVELVPERPNIYALYEANVGMITPMIADALKDAERDYPAQWIADAIQEAVKSNKRSWRYIESVLKNWQTEGKGSEKYGRYSKRNEQRKVEGKIDDFIIK